MQGKQIEQYRIVKKIGAGGMGEVYLAEDTKLGRNVALKFLPERFNADPEFISRFEHEARAAAALNHPNIITVHDLGEFEGQLYIVMEHIVGRTLAELIDAGEITIRKALELGIQICDGLDAAHSAGIVHRDIKPANILVDERGRARILDFGVAKSQKSTADTGEGTTHGTVQYESPEQTRGEKVDHRSDLFSFGSVLYEMLTGQLPFPGEYNEAIRYAIQQEAFEPLARYKKDVPAELEQVVERLLEKEPEMRFQTAGGVIADLKRIQRDLTQTTPPVRRTAPATVPADVTLRTSGRRRILIPTAVGVVLLALVAVFKPWQLQITSTKEAQAMEDRLAIMYFDNLADPDDTQRNGEIVTNLLITNLTGNPGLQIVSSQRLYDLLLQVGTDGSRRIDREVASHVAEKARARWMLTGNIVRTEPTPILTAQLVEVSTGNVMSSTRINGKDGDDLFTLVDSLSSEIRSQFALIPAHADTSIGIAAMTTSSQEAYRYYLEGIDYEQKYKFDDAQKAFQEAIALDSNFAMAYYHLSFNGGIDGDETAASRKAVELSKGLPELDRLYIQARHAEVRDWWPDSADTKKTDALYQEIIEKYPEEKQAYFRLAVLSAQSLRKSRDRAIELFEEVIELDPLHKLAYNEIAGLSYRTGHMEKALWAINKYIELAPNEANPYDTKGDMYAYTGQLEEAIASYEKALQVDPDFVLSMRKLAYTRLFAGDIAGATAIMQDRAMHPNPEVRRGGLAGLKNIALYQGKLREAVERERHFRAATRLIEFDGKDDWHLENAWAWFFENLYWMSKDQQWLDSAEAMRSRVKAAWEADTTPGDFPFYDNIWYQLTLHNFVLVDSVLKMQVAKKDTTELRNQGNYWDLRFNNSYEKGRYDTAVYYGKLRIAFDPTFSELLELGRAQLLAGEISAAVTNLERAAKQFDDDRIFKSFYVVSVYYWLGRAYEASGWNDKAVEQYQKVCDIWKDADPGIKDHEDAKARLANLTT